jgi:hypothetical protein
MDSNGRLEILITARLDPSAGATLISGSRSPATTDIVLRSQHQFDREPLRHMDGDLFGIRFVVDRLPLLAGEYRADAYLLDATGLYRLDRTPHEAFFRVRQHTTEVGVARLPHRWEDP